MLQRSLPAPAHLHRVLCILGRLALHKSALRWVGKSGCLPQQTAWGKAVRGFSGCALRDACVRANGAGEHSRRRYTYLSAPNTYDEYAVPRSPAVSAAIARSTRERPCDVIAAAAGVRSLSDCGSSGGSNYFRCSCSDVLRFRSLARSLPATFRAGCGPVEASLQVICCCQQFAGVRFWEPGRGNEARGRAFSEGRTVAWCMRDLPHHATGQVQYLVLLYSSGRQAGALYIG